MSDNKQKVIDLVEGAEEYKGYVQLIEPVVIQLAHNSFRANGSKCSFLSILGDDDLGLVINVTKGVFSKKVSYMAHNQIFERTKIHEESDLKKLNTPKRFEDLVNQILSLGTMEAVKKLEIDSIRGRGESLMDESQPIRLYFAPTEWEILHWDLPKSASDEQVTSVAGKLNIGRGYHEVRPMGRKATHDEFKNIFGESLEELFGIPESEFESDIQSKEGSEMINSSVFGG